MTRIKKSKNLIARKNRVGYIFVMPFIIGLVAIFVPTVFDSLVYSFSEVSINFDNVSNSFIGWKNFTQAFTVDIYYRKILLSTIRGMLLDTLIVLLFSFFIANILNQKFIGRSMARMIFFLPVILSTGIVTVAETGNIAMSIYSSSSNNVSAVAGAFGSGGLSSFFDLESLISAIQISPQLTDTILYAVENTYKIVNSSGVQILIFLSALQSINPSVFEAAKVEGATKWEEFWKITFPLLTPMILVNTVFTVVDSFTNPEYKVLEYIQQQAFESNKMGYASALSWVYFLIVLVVLGIVWKLIARRVHYLE